MEIVVPAPPAEAFSWVVEPGLLREWMPQLEELRPRGFLHHAPLVRHGALQLALDVRVHRVVVPQLLELDVTWRGTVARLHLEVEEHEDGSTVTWRTGLELPPSLRLAGPGVARELGRIMRRNLELLALRLGESRDDASPHDEQAADPSPADDASELVVDTGTPPLV